MTNSTTRHQPLRGEVLCGDWWYTSVHDREDAATRRGSLEGTRIGDLTLCQSCGKAIQLIRSRNPETNADHDFWVHYAPRVVAGLIETHKAIPKRLWSDQ